jgi:glutamate/tyrosine decarboxylase-like PLP-dependent enzyme
LDRTAFHDHLTRSLDMLDDWQASWGAMTPDATTELPRERVTEVLAALGERLRENYPYFHPRYAGQMLKPPHPVAVIAYTTAMHINPNNHALDGGKATSAMEREVVAELASMFGYGAEHLGHLTSGGTVANLEALWVARSLHPHKAIASSAQAHYTHPRMCELIGARHVTIPADGRGRMDVTALREMLASGEIGTVVATVGTTGLGALDPVHEIVPLAQAAGARVHVDAAYGGFFALLARGASPHVDPMPFEAIAACDSIVVDPHKHGLQPYGCGSVLFRDPAVGRFYVHDSPYTYFTSDELHLGEITLECSRAGATAAALWATLRCLPLERESGLGPILRQSRLAALEWARLLAADERFRLVVEPDLDILAFYPVPSGTPPRASQISALTEQLFRGAMDDRDDPVFLAKLVVDRHMLARRDPSIEWDTESVQVVRSVLMKPEHLAAVPSLHAAIIRQLERAEVTT